MLTQTSDLHFNFRGGVRIFGYQQSQNGQGTTDFKDNAPFIGNRIAWIENSSGLGTLFLGNIDCDQRECKHSRNMQVLKIIYKKINLFTLR